MTDKPISKVDDIKTAEVVGKAEPLPVAKTVTLSQQVFIWSMILLVGVIFGVGSSWTLLSQSGREINGIGENELMVRQETARRLQDALNPSRQPWTGEQFETRSYEDLSRQIQMARYAARQGLTPTGESLAAIEREFLATPVPSQKGRTYFDLLAERKGAKDEVTPVALRKYLAERGAIEALFAREMVMPAVPQAVAEDVQLLTQQKILADEVVLTAEHLLPAVPGDDPEIQATYDRLRSARFTRPARITATVAQVDLSALIATEAVGDGEIAARYEQTKDMWKQPATDAATPAIYKPLAEVTPDIKAAIARERAEQKARVAIDAFNQVVDAKGLENAEAPAFAAAATEAKLIVTNQVIAQPEGGQIDLGPLGRMKDPANLFAKQKGFISNPLQATGDAKTWFIVRIDQIEDAGFQDLAQVKDTVIRVVAGQRAYKDLLAKAETLRQAAQAKGPAGLAALVMDPAQAAWKAVATSPNIRATTEYRSPASEPGAAAGEPRLAVSLAAGEVIVAETTEAAGDVPQVRLVQIREITPAPAIENDKRGQMVENYRAALQRYRARLFEQDLKAALGR